MLVSEYQRKLLRSLIPPNVLERMNAQAHADSIVLESCPSSPIPAAPAGVSIPQFHVSLDIIYYEKSVASFEIQDIMDFDTQMCVFVCVCVCVCVFVCIFIVHMHIINTRGGKALRLSDIRAS